MKVSPGLISRDVGAPIGAIRAVLSEPPPSAEVTPTAQSVSVGAHGSTAPFRPQSESDRSAMLEQLKALELERPQGWPMADGPGLRHSPSSRELTATSLYDNLARVLELSGLRKDAAALAVERFQYYPADDYARLTQILADLGAPQAVVRSAIGLYREQAGDPERPLRRGEEDDPTAKVKRQLAESLSTRLLEAEVRRAEREAQAPQVTGGGDPGLHEEIRELKRELIDVRGRSEPTPRERELAGQLALLQEEKRLGQLAGLQAGFERKFDELRRELTHRSRSMDDVVVGEADASTAIKADASRRLVQEVGDRVAAAPRLGSTVSKILDSPGVSHALVDRVRGVLASPEELAGVGQPPSDEDLLRAAAALEAQAQSDAPRAEPEGPPPLPVPGAEQRRLYRPPAPAEQPSMGRAM